MRGFNMGEFTISRFKDMVLLYCQKEFDSPILKVYNWEKRGYTSKIGKVSPVRRISPINQMGR
jgi:hypothetical protein